MEMGDVAQRQQQEHRGPQSCAYKGTGSSANHLRPGWKYTCKQTYEGLLKYPSLHPNNSLVIHTIYHLVFPQVIMS